MLFLVKLKEHKGWLITWVIELHVCINCIPLDSMLLFETRLDFKYTDLTALI